ncbi:MAG: AMP-polyphosphate phosphotransferase [Methanolobus sp.]|nr:AMP-polyphosphate phosphotransferase [Methanolobus sp.]
MLEKIDLSKKISNEEYKDIVKDLEIRMGELQRKAWKFRVPIIVVFEGWHAFGMSYVINRFLLPLDPRGFRFYTATAPTEEEKLMPFMWRFWTKIPARGQIAIFDRSWYRRAIIENMEDDLNEDFERCLSEINSFERQLADDGYLIVKLFLHISKEKQKQRLEELAASKGDLLIIGRDEMDDANDYDHYLYTVEKILESTDYFHSPWTIVEAENCNFAAVKIMLTLIEAISDKLKKLNMESVNTTTVSLLPEEDVSEVPSLKTSILANADLSRSLTKDEYKEQKKKYQEKLRYLQYEAFRQKIPVIILFEGWDASGKGGNIRRLTKKLNPRIYSVIPVEAPNDYEIAHHYLWRFANKVPAGGQIAIFDRSWYGRVLVERVEELCTQEEWKRAYKEINEFESMLTEDNAVIIKFWLHLDQETQLKRFKRRANTPHKQWKITPDDWRNRENWNLYREAVDEMLEKTSTTYAPWTIVEANDKRYSRIKTLKTIVKALEQKLQL